MYTVQDIRTFVHSSAGLRSGRRVVSRTVIFLGLTSMFTDISSEMVATILPLYLVLTLGFTPLQFGVVDGYQRGAAALVSLSSGLFSDKRKRHKEVATAGYGLSAICKPLYVAVGASFAWLGAVAGHRTVSHGVEHFGQTGTIGDLYRHFGLDRQALARSVLELSAGRGIKGAARVAGSA